jgi:anthranilate 1,2-dioxygenase (deaminating, decarboxylating) small subunit
MTREAIEQFLFLEAELCDQQDWQNYLELYDESCEFHVPQWDSEHVFTTDPLSEMSLMYYKTRAGLEDRVFRLGTGQSAASEPLPRTVHMISNIRSLELEDGYYQVKCNWMTNYFHHNEAGNFFGWSEYKLRPHHDSWRIAKKHVVILNDTIKHVLDFYHI